MYYPFNVSPSLHFYVSTPSHAINDLPLTALTTLLLLFRLKDKLAYVFVNSTLMNPLRKLFNKLQRPETEAIIWIIALIYLLLVNPYQTQHYSFCVFKLAGFNHCPGCGLGRSIAFIFYGDFLSSFKSHPLGLFALGMIIYRIVTLLSLSTIFNKLKLGGKSG